VPDRKRTKPAELDTLCRAYTHQAIKQISGIMINDLDSGRRLMAAGMLLDRGYGKPSQPHDAKVDGELRITIRKMMTEDGEQ
jgi:hypothetical protein